MKKKGSKHIYQLELTERQAKLLSYACDQFMRCIQGQPEAFQQLMEEAWEKRCKEAVGGTGMDKEWNGGWWNMRHQAERLSRLATKWFWGCRQGYGIHYDDAADIFFDIHRVLRYQFYKDSGDTSKAFVDSENPTSPIGSEPLPVIRRTDVSSDEIMKDMEALYSDIDKCIDSLLRGRVLKNDTVIANARHKMESLMVRTQQELRVIADYLRNDSR
jgi:hypothetical protein